MKTLEEFIDHHLKLLELERLEELEISKQIFSSSPKSLEEKGLCLRKLKLENICSGSFGDTLVEFSLANPTGIFKSHTFSSGSIVGVYDENSGMESQQCIVTGLVHKVGSRDITMTLDESADASLLLQNYENSSKLRLVKLPSDVTYKRIKQALESLRKSDSGRPGAYLSELLFCQSELESPYDCGDITFFNSALDNSQQEAVRFSLSQRNLAIIHGPPGTGKTTTLVEVIRQLVYHRRCRVLVCAPSNMAVDNLVERLATPLPTHQMKDSKKSATYQHLLRLGHPTRAQEALQKFTLDARLAESDQREILQEVRREFNNLWSRGGGAKRLSRDQRKQESNALRKEIKDRESKAMQQIFDASKIVFSTLTSLTTDKSTLSAKLEFDVVVIDECSQAIEAACWLAIPRGRKCIIAGDHKQLPPTILSKKAESGGLSVSMMERLLSVFDTDQVSRMLLIQYRMHETIMNWSSLQFYQSKLQAHLSVKDHLLSGLECITQNGEDEFDNVNVPLVFIDTDSCDINELDIDQELSKGNPGEADLVIYHVVSLLDVGLPGDLIGVITPYNLQVEIIRSKLHSDNLANIIDNQLHIKHLNLSTSLIRKEAAKVEVRSVDGFQGREKEAIVISMVRSNKKGEVGFLAEHRRLNVAVTRARRHLCVIGDSRTIGSCDSTLKSLVDYLTNHAELRSAQEYIISNGNLTIVGGHDTVDAAMTRSRNGTKSNTKQSKPSSHNKQAHKKPSFSETKTITSGGNSKTSNEEEERQYYANIIRQFFHSDDQEYHFSDSLNPRERALIHELADSFSLCHVSTGEGKHRHLVLSKLSSVENTPIEVNGSSNRIGQQPSEDHISQQFSGDSSITNCIRPFASIKHVKHNQSHKLDHTKTQKKEPSKMQTDKLKSSATSKVKANPIENIDDDDFDALIAAAQKLDGVCNMSSCKTLVRTLGMDCRFCARRFCLSHHQAEIHGCEKLQHQAARQQLSKEGAVRPGSGKVNHLPNPTTRKLLERKLHNKINNLEETRSSSSKKDKKK